MLLHTAEARNTTELGSGDLQSLPVLNPLSTSDRADDIQVLLMEVGSLNKDGKAKKAGEDEHTPFVFTLVEGFLESFPRNMRAAAKISPI